MGATIFTRQHIEVLPLADGTNAFVLWEEHYESNVYPHNPHWSCTGFGRRPEALRTIFAHAAGCEGGLFRPRSGPCRPESYIRRWQRAAKQASICPTTTVRLDRSMKPFFWNDGEERAFDNTMSQDDPLDEARRGAWNQGQTIEIELPAEFDVLAAIVRSKRIPAWRVFKSVPDRLGYPYDAQASLFPHGARKKATETFAPLVRISQASDNLYEEVEPGKLVHRGYAYSAVAQFVKDAADGEIHLPGTFHSRIAAFRKHALEARVLEATTLLMPFVPEGTLPYPAAETAKMIQRYPQGLRMRDIEVGAKDDTHMAMYEAANIAGYQIVA